MRKSSSTIDPRFVKMLPTSVTRDFEWIFPASGPGMHADMQRAFSILTNDHVLNSSFANMVNELQRQRYFTNYVSYLEQLEAWMNQWPSVECYAGIPPLHAWGYSGCPMVPYSAFGEPGQHNGLKMTERFVKAIFNLDMTARGKYTESSFQARHDEGCSIDDTFKYPNKIFVNTTGRSRVQPFAAMQTILSRIGFIVSARFKHSKSHQEVEAILGGIKACRENAGAPGME